MTTTMLGASDRRDLDLRSLPVPPTLAEVRVTVATWDDLPATKIRKLQAALSTLGRALAQGQPQKVAEKHIRFDCPTIRPFRAGPAATIGLSSSRRASALSEIVFMLQRLGFHEQKSRGKPITSPGLKGWHDSLPKGHQIASIGFFRHLDREGIEFGQITTETLSVYREKIEKLTVCADPDRRLAQVLTALNWASRHVPGWPLSTLRLGPSAETEMLGLPLTRFSEAFQEDVRRCLDGLAGAARRLALFEANPAHMDPDSNRTARNLRPASIESVLRAIRCGATILVRQGVPITEIDSLQDLFVPFARTRTILESELDRNQGRTRYSVHKLASVLAMLASRYCDVPKAEVEQIRTWVKRLRMPKTKGMTPKNRRRLRTLTDQRVRAMMLHFPTHLMAEAAMVVASQPKVAARLAMYAAALEILLVCPLRRANLVGLRLDRHLHRPDPRKALITHIFIEEHEVKNEEALQWPLPVESAKLIATYLNRYRHHLTGLENQYLLPGKDNRSLCPDSVAGWVSRSMARYIGVEFNLHLIRHFSAWNFLRQNPGQYEVVRRALGHKTLETTIRYYVGLEAEAAAKHFDTAVLRDRQGTRIIAKEAFRAGRGALGSGQRDASRDR